MKLLLLLLIFTLPAFAKEILLTENNTVSLNGPVNDSSILDVQVKLQELSALGEASEPIYLVLNTPGGSVMAGLDLIQYMNTLRRPVYAVANTAISMGFHILQSSAIRYVTPYATVMSHRAHGGFEGDIPQQLNSRISHINQLLSKMDEQVISRTNGKHDKASYTELIRDEAWFVGDNAVTGGFADEVVTLKCSDELNSWTTKTIKFFIFTINVKFSNCPLISTPIVEQGDGAKEFLENFTKIVPLGL